MYPIEMYLEKLKEFIGNIAHQEVCIVVGRIADEMFTYSLLYLNDSTERWFNRARCVQKPN